MARLLRLAKKSASRSASTLVSGEEIAKVAYELYERRGKVHGHDREDWLEAERIVRQRQGNGNGR